MLMYAAIIVTDTAAFRRGTHVVVGAHLSGTDMLRVMAHGMSVHVKTSDVRALPNREG